jgi:ribonuclease P/MRP protein subunit POP5
MNHVPVRNGRPCVFRVVRVSGTIRKVEKEAVRRARLLILAAKDEMAGRSSSDALGALLRSDGQSRSTAMLVDQADSEPEPDDGEASDDG